MYLKGQLTTQHSKEISDLQMTMAKQEAVIESKSDEVDILTTHLSERVAQLDSTSHELTKTKEELVSIHRWIAEGTDLVRSCAIQFLYFCCDTGSSSFSQPYYSVL